MEISIRELISWGITLISLVTLWNNHKKHSKDYMIVQGLMRSISEYSKLYAHQSGEIDKGNMQSTKDNMKMLLNFAFSANNAIMQQVLGVIKSLGIKKDIHFDAQEFINKKEDMKTSTP